MSDIVTAFIAYRTERARLKRQYREQMETELAPYLAQFGQAVVEEQSQGKSIEEVEHLIGVRNRNLIYAAKRAAKGLTPAPSPATPDQPSKDADTHAERRVEVLYSPSDDAYYVNIDNVAVGIIDVLADGTLSIPEEWALDTENAALYREAVNKVRAALKE